MAITVGPEHRVNTTTSGDQQNPAIAALAGGGYVITWSDRSLNGFGVTTQLFDAAGNPIGSEIDTEPSTGNIGMNASAPAAIGLTGSGFVVGYAFNTALGGSPGSWLIRDVQYDAAGQLVRRYNNPLIPFDDVVSRPALAPLGSDFITVWNEQPSFLSPTLQSRIRGQDFAGNGVPFTIAQQPASSTISLRNPDVAELANGNWVVVWDQGGLGVHANVFTPADISVSGEFSVNATTQSGLPTPRVTGLANGNFVVAWSTVENGSSDVLARLFAPNGHPLGSDFLLNTNTVGDQELPDIAALPRGGF